MGNNNTMSIFLAGLTLLFIGLKLTNQITWSWWWVLAPFWIPTLLGLLFVLFMMSKISKNKPKKNPLKEAESEKWQQRKKKE